MVMSPFLGYGEVLYDARGRIVISPLSRTDHDLKAAEPPRPMA
jgi:hypothetical protein